MHRQKVATVLEITYNEAGTYFMLSAKTKTISDGDGNLKSLILQNKFEPCI